MQTTIFPAKVSGKITAPPSKSVMQRVCAAAFISGGTTVVHNYGKSEDDKAALQLIQDMGASVNMLDDLTLEIIAPQDASTIASVGRVQCGESGLAARMFIPIVARASHEITIEGRGSLITRPMDFFDSVLPQLGVTVLSNEGKLPLSVRGPLQLRDISIDGSLSSQFLTGLLLAYGASTTRGARIEVDRLSSKPYIDLTLDVMNAFGLNVPRNEDYRVFDFPEKTFAVQSNRRREYTIEGDWSGAAFFMVAGAISGSAEVDGLDAFSVQADKAILQPLQESGCRLSIHADRVVVSQHSLKPFHFNATDCPDLFPPLVALAAYCAGTSVIEGVHRLVHKESNRVLTLQQEFAKLGIEIQIQDDMMIVRGGKVRAATVDSHGDHRIAMSCAIAALGADGPVTIRNARAVQKSYPEFFEHLNTLGGAIETQ